MAAVAARVAAILGPEAFSTAPRRWKYTGISIPCCCVASVETLLRPDIGSLSSVLYMCLPLLVLPTKALELKLLTSAFLHCLDRLYSAPASRAYC